HSYRANPVGDRVQSYTSIYHDAVIQPTVGTELGYTPDLVQSTRNELLGAKTGIYRHYQHVVHDVEHFAEGLNRRGRVDDNSGQQTMAANYVQRAVQVAANFLVH